MRHCLTKPILRRGLSVAGWAVIGGAAALGLARQVELRSVAGVGVVAVAPWSLIPAALAVGGLAALRDRRSAVIGGLVVALIGWPNVATFIPARKAVLSPIVTVMSANILHGKADPAALVAGVRSREVDVLAVQELTMDSIDRLSAAGLDEVLPHRLIGDQDGGTDVGIWSRHSLTDTEQLTGFALTPVRARITVAGRELTVIAFHSKAPVHNGGTALWQSDLERLAGVMANPSTSTIVAGDFNATRDHRQFRDLLDAGYSDAGSDAGAGILPTWPADRLYPPLIGIDHVLVSNDLVGVDVTSVRQPGSDHLAVVATVAPSSRID